jgi:DNA-binding NtrC family response regulator
MNSNSRKTVLVVDDEPLVCESFRMMLDLDGHRMEEASTGAEALHKMSCEKFDVVFTDFFMPGMKGDQLAREIRNRSDDTPVVMVTGFPPNPTPMEVQTVIVKPFDLSSIRETLAGL